jgi:DNA-binding CsgD family transcriptional regulator
VTKWLAAAPGGWASTKNCSTSPRAIRYAERIAEALDYRRQGFSYSEIAKQMRCSLSTAHGYITDRLAALVTEDRAEVLKLELDRLDQLMASIYAAAAQGDVRLILGGSV